MPTMKVNGMHCPHCSAAVEKAAAGVAGVINPRADLEKAELSWEEESPVSLVSLKNAIRIAGFSPE